ncbi:ABC-2 family transporter protein [Sneathia sanguinegens]|uniref:ABC-2 family transporter protein n=1 Tax=Sneathia sanguinegens TaxID=40543 RepID=UPI0023F61E87|nr:ABC-2 family transporter protein [Sneathia sanguinegens]
MIIQISGLFFISIIFKQTPEISGFNLNQMIALYRFSQITRVLDHFYSDYLWFFATNGVI